MIKRSKINLILFATSFAANVVLAFFCSRSLESSEIEARESARVEALHKRDIDILGQIAIGKVTRDEVLSTFKAGLRADEYFEKPSESGIGAGTMFLRFDENNVLVGVESAELGR